MYKKIIDIIIALLIIGNIIIAIIWLYDSSIIEKLDNDTKTAIGLLMVSSWALGSGLALSTDGYN